MLVSFTVSTIWAVDNNNIRIDRLTHQLVAPQGHSYQWYFEGNLIEGEISANLKPDKSGKYKVVITDQDKNSITKNISVAVEENSIIQIFIIGDSTVANYGSSAYPFAGWGQVFQHFFDDTKVSTQNRARGGRSSRSFYEEGLWDNVVAELATGNYVFIQFGHNDRDYSKEERYTSPEDYKTYLAIYINDSRALGAIPVLVSPMNMNSTSNVFTEYRAAMLEVAEKYGCTLYRPEPKIIRLL